MKKLKYLLPEGKRMTALEVQSKLKCDVLDNSCLDFAVCSYSFGQIIVGIAIVGVNHRIKEIRDVAFFPLDNSSGLLGNRIGSLAFGQLMMVAHEYCGAGEGYNFVYPISKMSDDFKRMLIKLNVMRWSEANNVSNFYSAPFIPMLKQTLLSLEDIGYDVHVERKKISKLR